MNRRLTLALTLLLTMCGLARAEDLPALQTNQAYVEEVLGKTTLDPNDLMGVFGYVMSKLPERVKVYPTENYYYFWFIHNGIRYAGNIRLDASNRDDGKVIFAYFEDTSVWYEEADVKHKILDAMGDLYLIGKPLLASYSAFRSGHALNNRLLRAVFADETAFRWMEG